MGKQYNQRKRQRYTGVPHAVMEHSSYIQLGFSARALLLEIAKQYNSHNNGKLCAIPEQLKQRGFDSSTTVYKAVKELLNADLIIYSKVSRKGSRQPHYYAITWAAINDIANFEMDILPTKTPPKKFSIENQNRLVA